MKAQHHSASSEAEVATHSFFRGLRPKLLVGLAFAALAAAPLGVFAASTVNGPMAFDPIAGSAYPPAQTAAWGEEPLIIPEGYRQYRVSDEAGDLGGGPGLNIYPTDDLTDMNTTNETGKKSGRFMYRTHEVGSNGALSVIDLESGETKVLAQNPAWRVLDGIVWTPWGTILFAEEIDSGHLFELVLDKNDPTEMMTVIDRPAVGRLAHEGIQIDSDGAVYVVDEHRGQTEGCDLNGVPGDETPCGGGIYKFVPDQRGNLSSGELFVLKVVGPDGTGQGEWVGPIDPLDARRAGTLAGGTSYQRPEDLQIIGNTLYAAVTEGPRNAANVEIYDGRVLAINLKSLKVTDFVKPGVNVPVETGVVTGFDNPDNLAKGPDGRLWIVEDNVPSDIWVTDADKNKDGAADNVYLFASLKDPGAEGTGIYFGKDPRTLFVNIQHATKALADGTWAITNRDCPDGNGGGEEGEDDDNSSVGCPVAEPGGGEENDDGEEDDG